MKHTFAKRPERSLVVRQVETFLFKVHRRINNYFNFDRTLLLKYLERHKDWDIGEYSYGHPSKSPKIVHFGEDCKLQIGNFCSFAEDVWIVFGGHHRTDWVTTYPFSVLFDDSVKCFL